jgi:hypothetical protein
MRKRTLETGSSSLGVSAIGVGAMGVGLSHSYGPPPQCWCLPRAQTCVGCSDRKGLEPAASHRDSSRAVRRMGA